MSIDYDRLRTTVDVVDDPEADKITRGNYTLALEWAGPALARELLALRREIERTRDRITAEIERTPAEVQAAKITLHTERVHMLGLCAHLLSGDYE